MHLVTQAINNPNLLNSTTILASTIGIVSGLYNFHKFISGKKIVNTNTADNNVTIQLEDSSTLTIAENIYNIYMTTPAIPESISKNFSALSEDPAVSNFEIYKDEEKIIEVGKDDYARMAIKQQIETPNSRIIVEAATIYISKLVFENSDRKWEFYHGGIKISAQIVDEEFYTLIDRGESFAKGDQLQVDLQVTQVFDQSIGTYVIHSYAVLKVHEHIKRTEPQQLPFDIPDEEQSNTSS